MRIEDTLSLSENPVLYYVGGWASLAEIGGPFIVRQTALTELSPWPPVSSVGALTLEDLPLLTTVANFSTLTHVQQDLILRNAPLLDPDQVELWLASIEVGGAIILE